MREVAEGKTGLLLVNGRVWLGGGRFAEAVAVAGEWIVAVGGSEELRAWAGPGTEVMDLGGRLLVPGFNDAHLHLMMGGASLVGVQLGGARSLEEFQRRIADFACELPAGSWLRNGNWDHQLWENPALPDHRTIDDCTGGHPALLWRQDAHMALANAAALRLAGIDRRTAEVPGGEIERDGEGNPTGILKDAATALVARVMPPLSPLESRRAMAAALGEAARLGVTSVQNMADGSNDTGQPALFRLFQQMEQSGALTVRVYESLPLRDWPQLAAIGLGASFGSPRLRLGNMKAFSDGALGPATAWMLAPYSGQPGKTGLASQDLLDLEGFYEDLRGADRAGLQLAIHAIGDRANRTLLELFERLVEENGPSGRRLRIEHAQHVAPEDWERFARLEVIASMQPYHAIDDGRWAESLLGPERVRQSFAWGSALCAGVRLAFGSDWPVAPLDPLAGIAAAVNRQTLDGRHPEGWVPEQRIGLEEALTAYTAGAAYAEGQERIKGRIAPGQLADFALLSEDLFAIAPERIAEVRVEMTICGGRIVYRRG